MDITAAALSAGLRKLFDTSSRHAHFNVCAFDNLIELADVPVPKHTYAAIRAFHCVNYADMTREEREALFVAVVGALSQEPIAFPQVHVDAAAGAPKLTVTPTAIRPLDYMPEKAVRRC